MIEGTKSDSGFHFSYITLYTVQSGGRNIVSPPPEGGAAWLQPPEVKFKNMRLVDTVISRFYVICASAFLKM